MVVKTGAAIIPRLGKILKKEKVKDPTKKLPIV